MRAGGRDWDGDWGLARLHDPYISCMYRLKKAGSEEGLGSPLRPVTMEFRTILPMSGKWLTWLR